LYQIGTGAVVGAAAVALAPVAIAAAGDVLVGAGLLTGSSTLFSAGTAAYGASAAVASAVYGIKSATSLPTLEVDSNRMPNIADNIRNAQANGAPTTLTRTQNTALIDANRAAATAGFTGPGSPDEYPFASTYEGGAGAFVRGVPLAEQRVQGGVISRFYQDNGIVDGSKFHVRVK
jgi:hypothetical protein